jgi:hypothetical protein
MKKIGIGTLLTIWILGTLLLTLSLVGLLIFIPSGSYRDDRSTWMKIGVTLTEAFIA